MNRFDYLTPAIGPVVNGLEDHEKIYALEQPEYVPLRTLSGENGNSAIYRVELTQEQRAMIADGDDVLIEILHFGGPLAPSRVMILNQRELSGQETTNMAEWFAVQIKARHLRNGISG